MIKNLLNELYDAGEILKRTKDDTIINYGNLMLKSANAINQLREKNAIMHERLAQVNDEYKTICEAGLNQKGKVLPVLLKQTEILNDMLQLRELLGIGKDKKDKDTKEPQLKQAAQQLIQRYMSAKDNTSKLDAIAGMSILAISPDLKARALKVAKAGGAGDTDKDES